MIVESEKFVQAERGWVRKEKGNIHHRFVDGG
jgi:hypothetical protein